jgi:hypothetical protein
MRDTHNPDKSRLFSPTQNGTITWAFVLFRIFLNMPFSIMLLLASALNVREIFGTSQRSRSTGLVPLFTSKRLSKKSQSLEEL